MAGNDPTGPPSDNRWFPPTHWTEVMAARREGSPAAADALESLCSTYWYPIYAYIRRKGHSDADAKDIAQGFFHHILERNLFGSADRTKGKFRSFLLGSLNYFLANRREFEGAKKRGGGMTFISMDDKSPEERYALEPADNSSPEKLFDRRWAADLLSQATARLHAEYARLGKGELFDRLRPFLNEDTASGEYGAVAEALGMTAGAVSTAVHRLRHRYGDLIESEVARTVASGDEVANERRYILEVVSGA